MPIGRQFEIVYLLLNKKTMTAGELARHFEVSTGRYTGISIR